MEFKIVERYYPVTLTKRSQLCKAKQFLKRFGNIKIAGNITKNWQVLSQPLITCSKLTIETLEQGVKHVQSPQ